MGQDNKSGGFLLGTVLGIAAGLAGGLAFLRQGRASGTLVEFRDEVSSDGGETEIVAVAAVQPSPVAGLVERIRAILDALQSRWNGAITEGKTAAVDRRRELQAQLSADTKRLPEFQAELLDAARERAPEAVREFERLTGTERMKDEG